MIMCVTSSSPGEDIGQDRLPQLPTWVENCDVLGHSAMLIMRIVIMG